MTEKFGADPAAVVEALRLAQARHGRLTGATVEAVAQNVNNVTIGALARWPRARNTKCAR